MTQYPEIYRIKISLDMREKLNYLKTKYHIYPVKFIRSAIDEKLHRDLPVLKSTTKKFHIPF